MANEKRLIDANVIPWEEHYVPDGDTQWEYKKELCVLKPVIDAMPTVDAVEVVRCKDCKKAVRHEIFPHSRRCKVEDCKFSHKETHFCSYGERKDNDGN